MGGNTLKGIYKHNVSYFSVPVNKYSLFSLDLLIQTLNFVMILNSYAGFGHDIELIRWGAMS